MALSPLLPLALALLASPPTTPDDPPQLPRTGARIEVVRGRATLLHGEHVEGLSARRGPRDLRGRLQLDLAPGTEVRVSWLHEGSLWLIGPASVEWAPSTEEAPGGLTIHEAGVGRLELRRGGLRVRAPGDWIADFERGAYELSASPTGRLRCRIGAGEDVTWRWVGDTRRALPPLRCRPGRTVHLEDPDLRAIPFDRLPSAPAWVAFDWPWGPRRAASEERAWAWPAAWTLGLYGAPEGTQEIFPPVPGSRPAPPAYAWEAAAAVPPVRSAASTTTQEPRWSTAGTPSVEPRPEEPSFLPEGPESALPPALRSSEPPPAPVTSTPGPGPEGARAPAPAEELEAAVEDEAIPAEAPGASEESTEPVDAEPLTDPEAPAEEELLGTNTLPTWDRAADHGPLPLVSDGRYQAATWRGVPLDRLYLRGPVVYDGGWPGALEGVAVEPAEHGWRLSLGHGALGPRWVFLPRGDLLLEPGAWADLDGLGRLVEASPQVRRYPVQPGRGALRTAD